MDKILRKIPHKTAIVSYQDYSRSSVAQPCNVLKLAAHSVHYQWQSTTGLKLCEPSPYGVFAVSNGNRTENCPPDCPSPQLVKVNELGNGPNFNIFPNCAGEKVTVWCNSCHFNWRQILARLVEQAPPTWENLNNGRGKYCIGYATLSPLPVYLTTPSS